MPRTRTEPQVVTICISILVSPLFLLISKTLDYLPEGKRFCLIWLHVQNRPLSKQTMPSPITLLWMGAVLNFIFPNSVINGSDRTFHISGLLIVFLIFLYAYYMLTVDLHSVMQTLIHKSIYQNMEVTMYRSAHAEEVNLDYLRQVPNSFGLTLHLKADKVNWLECQCNEYTGGGKSDIHWSTSQSCYVNMQLNSFMHEWKPISWVEICRQQQLNALNNHITTTDIRTMQYYAQCNSAAKSNTGHQQWTT